MSVNPGLRPRRSSRIIVQTASRARRAGRGRVGRAHRDRRRHFRGQRRGCRRGWRSILVAGNAIFGTPDAEAGDAGAARGGQQGIRWLTPSRERRTRVRVRYADTDRMGIAYHANYLVWFEVGRTDGCADPAGPIAKWKRTGCRCRSSKHTSNTGSRRTTTTRSRFARWPRS